VRRWVWRGFGLLAALIVTFGIIKESREPHWWLYIDDVINPKPDPITVPLSEEVAVRLYEDTRPHIGKIARLQKGLILVAAGEEVVEEGFGFGLPLVEVNGQTYLSRGAAVEEQPDGRLVKRYEMDTVDTPSGFLRQKYVPVPSIGTVVVTHTLVTGGVEIEVDLSKLRSDWQRAFLMNEQGATHFVHYTEPGRDVLEGEVGIWQPTRGESGCMMTGDSSLRFCVETEEAWPRYFGRERYRQYYWIGTYLLSWAGIDLELEPSTNRFRYRITLSHAAAD
jgi:hypothetical protein